MDVLEPAEVAAYGDQVQVLLVLLRVRRDRPAVGSFDHERDCPVPAGRTLGLREVERVAVLRHHDTARHLDGVLPGADGVAVLGAVTVPRVSRGGRVEGSHARAERERDGEDHRERHDEGGDPDGGAVEQAHETS